MFLNFIALLTAISISSVAAYYSIYGLTAIFSGVFWPIVIMGGVLEVGKIVTTVWLHTYWRDLRFFLKLYMSVAVIVLMFITSMGIFGFLSRAHIEVTSQAGGGELLIQQVDMGIELEKKRIEDARSVIAQMDNAINSLLKGSGANADRDNNRTAALTTQATKLRDGQKKERASLNASIDEANKRITELSKEKLRLQQEDLKIQAEVGPIKYIAQMIYDENATKDIMEKAVRWVIIIIVAVFDPLAVCMVLGVTMVMNKRREEREALAAAKVHDEIAHEIDRVIEKIVEVEVERVREVPVEVIREVEVIKEIEKPIEVIREVEVIKEIEKIVEIEKPVEVIKEIKIEDTDKLEELQQEIKSLLEELEQKDKLLEQRTNPIEQDEPVQEEESQSPAASILPDLEEVLAVKPDNAAPEMAVTFGVDFPKSAQNGQMFLKLDVIPSQLFKYNGNKWIQVDKEMNSSYANNQRVILMLMERLSSGEIEWDDLTAAEQEAVGPYLNRKI